MALQKFEGTRFSCYYLFDRRCNNVFVRVIQSFTLFDYMGEGSIQVQFGVLEGLLKIVTLSDNDLSNLLAEVYCTYCQKQSTFNRTDDSDEYIRRLKQ